MILWQRAATVPNRGSILSGSAHWHREQLQGGRRKVTAETRLNVKKQESLGPGVSRLRLIYKSLLNQNRAQRSSLRCCRTKHIQSKSYKASVHFLPSHIANLEYLIYKDCFSSPSDFATASRSGPKSQNFLLAYC